MPIIIWLLTIAIIALLDYIDYFAITIYDLHEYLSLDNVNWGGYV